MGFRRWAVLAVCALSNVLLPGCGGGGGDGGGGTAPTASNLVYAPQGAYQGVAGSSTTIMGTVDFIDPDGDLASWTLTIVDAGGRILQSTNQPVSGASGVKSGRLNAAAVVSTADLGSFTFRIELVDAQGLHSGALTGSFRVTERPWVTLPGLPVPRSGFATASLNGLIYVMGGDDPSAGTTPPPPTARVDVYDPVAGVWTIGAPMASPMSNFVAGSAGGHILAVGGTDAFGLNVQTQEFNPLTAAWSLRAPPGLRLRAQGGAVATGRFYSVGGDDGGFESAAVESFDPTGNLWRTDASMPSARRLLTAVAFDAAGSPRILALGGYGSTHIPDAGYFRSNEVYDPAVDAWTVRAPLPLPVARAAAAAFDGKVFVFGGENVSRAIDSAFRYDPAADAWITRAALPAPATRLRAEVVSRKVLVFTSSEIWVYTPDNDLW